MKPWLLVALGGGAGSLARYLVGAWVGGWTAATAPQRFPYGTLAVNLLGCLAIGVLAALAERQPWFGPGARLFLLTGVLGGFTTFSAFGLDAVDLLRRGEVLLAAVYAGASVLLGLAAVWLGLMLVAAIDR